MNDLAALVDPRTLETARAIIALMAPGLLFVFARSRFTTGRMDAPKDNIVWYFVVTVVYYAIVFGILPNLGLGWRGSWIFIVIIFPLALGIASGLDIQRGWSRKLFGSLGVVPVHPIPTAWDWHFGKHEASWVVITLQSGETIGGWYGAESFASSGASGYDMYIERIYHIGDDNSWHEQDSSLLIGSDEIRLVEFLHDSSDNKLKGK